MRRFYTVMTAVALTVATVFSGVSTVQAAGYHEYDVDKKTLSVRACLEKAFCKMCVTICGRFCPDEGAVASYDNRIRVNLPQVGCSDCGNDFSDTLWG